MMHRNIGLSAVDPMEAVLVHYREASKDHQKRQQAAHPTSVGDAPDTLRTHTENTYIHIITHTHIL